MALHRGTEKLREMTTVAWDAYTPEKISLHLTQTQNNCDTLDNLKNTLFRSVAWHSDLL